MDDKGYELSKSIQVDNPIDNKFNINNAEDSQTKLTLVFGCAKGMFIMMPNFDEPLEEFEEYM